MPRGAEHGQRAMLQQQDPVGCGGPRQGQQVQKGQNGNGELRVGAKRGGQVEGPGVSEGPSLQRRIL